MKHRDLLIGLALLVGCGSRGDHPSAATAVHTGAAARDDAPRAPDPIVKGIPHAGATMTEMAATEEGDAALTVDELNEVRLWPALDGTRSPVPVASASQVDRLALFHAGHDLVAVVLDAAGGVTLTRLGRDGVVHGRSQLPGERAYVEVVAVGDQLLAHTDDHAVELYTADGNLVGRLSVGHGERVTDLAARRGRAAAIISTADGAYVRWITTAPELHWEPAMRLPLTPRDDMFAIAPGKRRIALVDTGNTGVHVFDLTLVPQPVLGPTFTVSDSNFAIGFSDDDTVIVAGGPSLWWSPTPSPTPPPTPPSNDPWAVAASSTPPTRQAPGLGSRSAVVVDGYLIQPANSSLALMDGTRTRYLGWKDAAQSASAPIDDMLVMTSSGSKFSWLDDNLALVRSFDLNEHRGPGGQWRYGTAIGPHHVLTQGANDGRSGVVAEIVDADKPDAPIVVGTFQSFNRMEYFNGMLAVTAGHEVRRYRIDLVGGHAEELRPPLETSQYSTAWVRLFDPKKADGLVGIVMGWEGQYSEHQSLWIYKQNGTKLARTKVKAFDYGLVKTDETGRMYVQDSEKWSLLAMRGGTIEKRIPLPQLSQTLAISHDGTRVVTRNGQDIVMLDDTGAELWRTSLWGAGAFGFIAGDKRLAVQAPGGFVAYDAATGARVARECAWNFGLHDTAPDAISFGQVSVCEDPIVQ